MTPHEKARTEEQIERVLAGLCSATPSAGMEQRITSALARHANASDQVPRWWAWPRLPQLAGPSAVIALLIMLSVHLHRLTRPFDIVRIYNTESASASPENVMSPSQDFAGHAKKSIAAEPHGRFSGRPGGGTRTGKASFTRAAEASVSTDHDFPAPPLPLTEQERLLVRLVHREDPEQLALLSPAAREAERERDREQVQEFFKGPPMPPANFKLEPYPVYEGAE